MASVSESQGSKARLIEPISDEKVGVIAFAIALIACGLGVGTVSVMQHIGIQSSMAAIWGGGVSFFSCLIGGIVAYNINRQEPLTETKAPEKADPVEEIDPIEQAVIGLQLREHYEKALAEAATTRAQLEAGTDERVGKIVEHIQKSNKKDWQNIIYCALHDGGFRPNDMGFHRIWGFLKMAGKAYSNLDENEKVKKNWEIEVKNAILNFTLSDEAVFATVLRKIDPTFFSTQSQDIAKKRFVRAMKIFGFTVEYPRSIKLGELAKQVNTGIIKPAFTNGVELNIPDCSKDGETVHLFSVASQYGASENPDRGTPEIGCAMNDSRGDNTQGPKAQRTNFIAFELALAFLTHSGFNMLAEVMPSAGKTNKYNDPIEHGYLCPSDGNLAVLTNEMMANYEKAEYPCYSSLNPAWEGKHPVYLMLLAAPALNRKYSNQLSDKADTADLEKYASLANHLALFNHGIKLAKDTKKPVVIHLTLVGGGDFHNKTENLQWGIINAILFLQKNMEDNDVSIQIDCLERDPETIKKWKQIADAMELPDPIYKNKLDEIARIKEEERQKLGRGRRRADS